MFLEIKKKNRKKTTSKEVSDFKIISRKYSRSKTEAEGEKRWDNLRINPGGPIQDEGIPEREQSKLQGGNEQRIQDSLLALRTLTSGLKGTPNALDND